MSSVPVYNILKADESMARVVFFDGLYEFLPKDAELDVQAYTMELAANSSTPWRMHNGAGFFLIIQGGCRIEFRNQQAPLSYEAGQIAFQPLGFVHRLTNPSGSEPFVAVGIKFCRPGLAHDLQWDLVQT